MYSACSPEAQPGAGPLEALLGDVAMGAFDLARADRQPFGQGLAIVQLASARAEVAMAGSHGRVLVIDLGGLAMSGKRPQDGVETPALERLLLRLHPAAARGRVGRDRFRSGGQIFADVIEINQVAAWSPNCASLWPGACGPLLGPKEVKSQITRSIVL